MLVGIDEHLQQSIYDVDGLNIIEQCYYHENARGDTIALTDQNGTVLKRIEYSTYGQGFVVNDQGEALAFLEQEMVTYGFQGRRLDAETGKVTHQDYPNLI